MVSDYPERLDRERHALHRRFALDATLALSLLSLQSAGTADRRIVLRAENLSSEPTIVQFISGRGGPSANEMEVGHTATKRFLGQRRAEPRAPADDRRKRIAQHRRTGSAGRQRRVQSAAVARALGQQRSSHALRAERAANPTIPPSARRLLKATHKHARGIYPIAEFHFATQWNVTDDYLELPIGQLPLAEPTCRAKRSPATTAYCNRLSSTWRTRSSTPQAIAIYENPRGGRATGTYLIDGVLVQSHQVPPYSRYKVRQYVVPAHGFVRVTIVTMPEAGSSYPLKLDLRPRRRQRRPGGPGSPIY